MEQLIRDMQFGPAEPNDRVYANIPVRAGWPDHREWQDGQEFTRHDRSKFFKLITNATKTKAYVYVSTT